MSNERTPLSRAKEILLYTDSHPNELLVGVLHALILPFAMFELGEPYLVLQIIASCVGFFQLYSVLFTDNIKLRLMSAQLAVLVCIATVINFGVEDMLRGSHLGWPLIMVFAVWNVFRIHQQVLLTKE